MAEQSIVDKQIASALEYPPIKKVFDMRIGDLITIELIKISMVALILMVGNKVYRRWVKE